MRRSLRTTAIALATASLLGVLEIFRTALTRVLDGNTIAIHDLFHRVVAMWFTLVLASPWCAVMAQRFPFRRGRMMRTLLVHLGGGAVFTAIHMTLNLVLHSIFTNRLDLPAGPQLFHLYAFYVAMELSVYAAIVLVLLLLEARREASERAVAAARLERSATVARLESLRAQIRPHFLFNTLNTVAVLARKGDGHAVDRAIGDLGELLRASFDTSERQEIPLAEELDFLERYVHLQSIRFPDRLEVDWQVAEDSRRALVPPLLVQPLVENALEHGLATERGGRVRVAARREGDTLVLEVADEGPGFGLGRNGSDALAVEGAGDGPAGVGLANTRERLALLYGSRAWMTIGDGPNGGGLVRIRLPWRLAGSEEPGANTVANPAGGA